MALAHVVEDRASQLRSWARACSARQRLRSLTSQQAVLTQRTALAQEWAIWLRAHEQAEVDRESRCSARRMSVCHRGEKEPGHRAH